MESVVLDGFAVNPGDLSWNFLAKYGKYRIYDKTPGEKTADTISTANIVLTNRVHITEEVLKRCPGIKFVTALGTGYDMIDVAACRKRGIEVCNIPGYSTNSVAQMAFTLLLNLTTDINGLTDIVKKGLWTGIPGFEYQKIKFIELAGKTVGIYGCGEIGKRFGNICAAFGMNVLAYRRFPPARYDRPIEFVSLDRLFSESDYISFHCPLTDETRGLVNKDFISKMKRGAIIVNTSRGAVINENDVAEALKSGRLGGAGLDVLVKEPADPENPLLTAPNCLITPHSAWTSIEARKRLLGILDENIGTFLTTGKGINRVGTF